MKLREAIAKASEARLGYTITESDLIAYASELDGTVKLEIIDTHEDGESVTFEPYTESDLDRELLIPSPFAEKTYEYFFEAKLDYEAGETVRYQNSILLYNSGITDFAQWYNRRHLPKKTKIKYV